MLRTETGQLSRSLEYRTGFTIPMLGGSRSSRILELPLPVAAHHGDHIYDHPAAGRRCRLILRTETGQLSRSLGYRTGFTLLMLGGSRSSRILELTLPVAAHHVDQICDHPAARWRCRLTLRTETGQLSRSLNGDYGAHRSEDTTALVWIPDWVHAPDAGRERIAPPELFHLLRILELAFPVAAHHVHRISAIIRRRARTAG